MSMRIHALLAASLACLFLASCATRRKDVPGGKNVFQVIDLTPNGKSRPRRRNPNAIITNPNRMNLPALPQRKGKSPKTTAQTKARGLAELMTDAAKRAETVTVRFNVVNQELASVMKLFGAVLDFQYVVAPGVKGKISLDLSAKMSQGQVWSLLEQLLRMNGAFAEKREGILHILPLKQMQASASLKPGESSVGVTLIHLKNASPQTILPHLKPFSSDGASLLPIVQLNSIMVVDLPESIAKIREIAAQLDSVNDSHWPQISIRCSQVESNQILTELRKLLPALGFPVTTNAQGDGNSVRLLSIDRLNILVATAPTVDVLHTIEDWMRVLDRKAADQGEQLFFYEVQYSDVETLDKALRVFLPDTQKPTVVNETGDKAKTGRVKPSKPVPTESTGGTKILFGQAVKVFPDEERSRLVIQTTPRAYLLLEAFLRRLDAPPKQVLVQVSICDILLTDSTEYGVMSALSNKWKANTTNTTVQNGITMTIGKSVTPQEVFSTITAAAGKENTKVISAPQIITISGKKATINVGERVPVVTQERSDAYDGSIVRTVQYQDTGIILSVTPKITAGKAVKLELKQEVSSAQTTDSSTIDSPTIKTSILENTLMLENHTTVLLGGLISKTKSGSRKGIPYLSGIPFIGWIFGSVFDNESERELLLLLTVHVIDHDSDIKSMINRYHKAVEELNDAAK